MDSRSKQPRSDGDYSGDNPMYSRLFIVCDKKANQDDLREAFSKFGDIEDIKIPVDHNGTPKGVCFIKFSKTSEAAAAVEAMDKKTLPDSKRSLKVMVAVNRSEVETQDVDEVKYKRLFIHVPRNLTEEQLEYIFGEYGKLSAVVIQRDHNTGDSKGFAYVTYYKFSDAARAFENCGRQYRPVFAKPKWQKRPETSFESSIGLLARSNDAKTSLISMMAQSGSTHRHGEFTKVNFMCCPHVSQGHIERLFDIIPGMLNCRFFVDRFRNCAKGTVFYSNPISAAYAVDKLNEFEYPPGMLLFVKPDNSYPSGEGSQFNNIPGAVSKLRKAITSANQSGPPDLAALAEAIAEASKLIKIATGNALDAQIPDVNDINYCSAKLPPPKPLANIDSKIAKRCFLVCKPAPPPLTVLRDIFCRFGDLINVYTLPNKTVGYACYASEASADEALKTLHGAEVCGIRMRVLEAEEEAPPKKRKFDNEPRKEFYDDSPRNRRFDDDAY